MPMIYLIVGLGAAVGIGALLWWGVSGPPTESPDVGGQAIGIYGTDAQVLVNDALDDLKQPDSRHRQP